MSDRGRLAAWACALVPAGALPAGRALPPEQAAAWREDLRFMARESRTQFVARVAALEADMPALERHQVIVAMAKIVAAVDDGHTNIYPTRDPEIGVRTLPVQLSFFGDALMVRAHPGHVRRRARRLQRQCLRRRAPHHAAERRHHGARRSTTGRAGIPPTGAMQPSRN